MRLKISKKSAVAPLLLLVSLALVVTGCAGSGESEETGLALPEGCEEVQSPAPKKVSLEPPSKPLTAPTNAVVSTSCGDFTIALDVDRAPKTSASFASLAESGVYADTLIHRIEPGFVVQGGDPSGDGSGGPGYNVVEAPPSNLRYLQGVVAMAKTGTEAAGTSGSQFFVVTAQDAQLPPDYALLGEVVQGLDTVLRIEELGQAGGTPRAPVIIESVTVSPA
jgi:cyclophilin family peptidyl-prolyl cis-trans isomerase